MRVFSPTFAVYFRSQLLLRIKIDMQKGMLDLPIKYLMRLGLVFNLQLTNDSPLL